MNIELYKTISPRNKINKVLPQPFILNDVKLLTETNILQPILQLSDSENGFIANYNYIYIPYFSRYYFIESINKNINGLVTIKCLVDVLMSFATDIGNSNANIVESENPNSLSMKHSQSDNVQKLTYNYNDNVFDHSGKLYLTASYGINS